MKVIESLDEWWEAHSAGKLQRLQRGPDVWMSMEEGIQTTSISVVRDGIERGDFCWKSEQIKLVEVKTNIPDHPTMYIPQDNLLGPNSSFTYSSDSPAPNGRFSFSCPIKESERRTVIAEVTTDGE